MLSEFKDFLKRGNVLDLAVAVIIGGAFSSIVASLVNDIIMPFIGVLIGGIDFTAFFLQVGDAQLTYGNFIQAVINFLVIALVIFLLVRQVKKMEKPVETAPAAPPEPSAEEKLLAEIRDILKARNI